MLDLGVILSTINKAGNLFNKAISVFIYTGPKVVGSHSRITPVSMSKIVSCFLKEIRHCPFIIFLLSFINGFLQPILSDISDNCLTSDYVQTHGKTVTQMM